MFLKVIEKSGEKIIKANLYNMKYISDIYVKSDNRYHYLIANVQYADNDTYYQHVYLGSYTSGDDSFSAFERLCNYIANCSDGDIINWEKGN